MRVFDTCGIPTATEQHICQGCTRFTNSTLTFPAFSNVMLSGHVIRNNCYEAYPGAV